MLAHLNQLGHFQKVPQLFLPCPGRKMAPEFPTQLPHLLSSTCSSIGLHMHACAHTPSPLKFYQYLKQHQNSTPRTIYTEVYSQNSPTSCYNMSFLSLRKPVFLDSIIILLLILRAIFANHPKQFGCSSYKVFDGDVPILHQSEVHRGYRFPPDFLIGWGEASRAHLSPNSTKKGTVISKQTHTQPFEPFCEPGDISGSCPLRHFNSLLHEKFI